MEANSKFLAEKAELVRKYPRELILDLFAETDFDPVLTDTEFPESLRQKIGPFTDEAEFATKYLGDMNYLIFGGISKDKAIVFSGSSFRRGTLREDVQFFSLVDGDWIFKNNSYSTIWAGEPLKLIKSFLKFRRIDSLDWVDDYDTLFEDTGFEPIFRTSDIPKWIQDSFMKPGPEITHPLFRRVPPTELRALLADFDQDYNSGCMSGPNCPNYQLQFGGRSAGLMFLLVKTSGGIGGPRQLLWVFELDEPDSRLILSLTRPKDPISIAKTLVSEGLSALDSYRDPKAVSDPRCMLHILMKIPPVALAQRAGATPPRTPRPPDA